MSREDDVMVVGRVIELAATGENGVGESWHVDVADQAGEHRSGRKEHVSARRVRGRPTLKMHDSGVFLRSGDEVKLLVNPTINSHVCAIIRIERGASARKASAAGHAKKAG